MEKLKIKIILGSTRKTRFGDKPANWILKKAKTVKEFDVELLDLRDYPMPFFDEELTPSNPDYKYPTKEIQKWADKITEADGFIIVTPEYNHGYPAVLKNAMDYLAGPWQKKIVGFVAYGSVGGARAVEQLRQVVIELQMASTRTAVHIPEHWNMKTENGEINFNLFDYAATGMLEQLLWWGKALKAGRSK